MIWRGTHLRPLSQGPGHAAGAAGGTFDSADAARKAQLRRAARIARSGIPVPLARTRARAAARNLLRTPTVRRAHRVAVYLAHGRELETTALISALHRRGKGVFVPSIDAHRDGVMHMLQLGSNTPLRRSRLGIREPVARRRPARPRIDVLVLPLVAFDAQGHRLGSGRGFYDRWLAAQRPRPFCIGYAFAAQQVERIPAEPWDQRLDAICTERAVRRFSRTLNPLT